MISTQAQDGFDHLLIRSLKASLPGSIENCDIGITSDVTGIEGQESVVLTVSSYLFRLMVMIHFKADATTMEYMARMNGMQVEEMNQQSFHDALAEYGNLCCGILNRELGAFFPHIGMSTPNFIDGQCMSYIQMLNCSHVQHFVVGVDGAALFHVSLCVSAYADLDFEVTEDEENANTGELELF
ncbi:chemotaxis protein CheX [Herminiimonas arsenitoxidans]|uniref:chemotaxis protein CheX n=1 Tax=Herminiimonas arsenitoxidans TaxID=1809410 RepID=UPI0009713459|nr:chemotaxis protein CheX [Herminiimonas arsenitoxidans]